MSSGDSQGQKDEAVLIDDALLPEDMERFRMATMRAKLASYGVYAERNADEDLLCRLLRIAEQRAERRLAQQMKHAQHAKHDKEYMNE